MQATLGMGDGLDQGHVGADHVLEDVLGVAGGAHAQDLQAAALIGDLGLQPGEDVLHVLDGVALGQLVRAGNDPLVGVDKHALGAG